MLHHVVKIAWLTVEAEAPPHAVEVAEVLGEMVDRNLLLVFGRHYAPTVLVTIFIRLENHSISKRVEYEIRRRGLVHSRIRVCRELRLLARDTECLCVPHVFAKMFLRHNPEESPRSVAEALDDGCHSTL